MLKLKRNTGKSPAVPITIAPISSTIYAFMRIKTADGLDISIGGKREEFLEQLYHLINELEISSLAKRQQPNKRKEISMMLSNLRETLILLDRIEELASTQEYPHRVIKQIKAIRCTTEIELTWLEKERIEQHQPLTTDQWKSNSPPQKPNHKYTPL